MLVYSSFAPAYKQPFGATLPHHAHTFHLKITEMPEVTTADLVVFEDGRWQEPVQTIALKQTTESDWSAVFTPEKSGLYFYFFQVQTPGQTWYYGCQSGGYGGIGQVYKDRDAVQMYQLTILAAQDRVPEWYKNAVFYHIFVDRFDNGNPDGHVNAPKPNSFLYGTQADLPYYVKNEAGDIVRWDFYGGNLLGIEKRLPYLKQLGVTALYLSPIFEARSNHRYDTGDYLKIDPVLGTLGDFEHFLKAVHLADMHVILDGVFNHVGADSRYFNLYRHYEDNGAANHPDSPYHDWFTFKHYPDQYASWWGVSDLPAIVKDSEDFQRFIAGQPDSVVDYWTAKGVDGWRLDVADELSDAFIRRIRRSLNAAGDKVLIGEVWEDASHKISYGQRRQYLRGDGLQAVMNYPLRQLLIDFCLQMINPETFVNRVLTLKENYPPTVFNYNFNNIGSHDTVRILTALGGNRAKLKLILQLFFTLPGVPCLYYGDEAGLIGGKDPDNRRFFPWHDLDRGLFAFVQQLIDTRRRQPVFSGAADFHLFSLGQCLGYVRQFKTKRVVCFANPTDESVLVTPEMFTGNLLAAPTQQWVRTQLNGLQLAANGFMMKFQELNG